MTSYPTSEAAKAALLDQGFTRYIEPIQGVERFSKPGTVDPALGAYPRLEIARIRHHWVDPRWGDPGNYFTIEFL
jgi:hypothetical protein